MGMAVSVDIRGRDTHPAAVDAVVEWLHWVDRTFSTYKPDSAISSIRRGELLVEEAPPAVIEVLERCEGLRRRTDGYFDAFATGSFDPSGYVKGWAVDVASDILVERGAADHAINAGGDLRLRGSPRDDEHWNIAVTHPLVSDAACAVLVVGEGAVATSGTAERGGHVFDPHTGQPALDLASVTLVGADLATTDALATAALARGLAAPDWLAVLPGIEALVVDATGMVWSTSGLKTVDAIS